MSAPTHVTPVGPPPSDRRGLFAHVAWEGVLLVGAAVVVLIAVSDGEVLAGRVVWPSLATTGLAAAGLALSLRTGTPNLLATSAGLLAGYLFITRSADGGSTLTAAIVAIVVVSVIGLVVALLDAVLDAPSWIVTLGVGIVLQGFVFRRLVQPPVGPTSVDQGVFILVAVVFAGLSALGGIAFAFAPVRQRLGGLRGERAPVLERLQRSLVGIGLSTVAFAVSGVLFASLIGTVSASTDRLTPTLAVVLLAGVSPWGGRGGVAGVVLATVLLVILDLELTAHNEPFWVVGFLVPGLAIVVGLGVSRLIDLVATGPSRSPSRMDP